MHRLSLASAPPTPPGEPSRRRPGAQSPSTSRLVVGNRLLTLAGVRTKEVATTGARPRGTESLTEKSGDSIRSAYTRATIRYSSTRCWKQLGAAGADHAVPEQGKPPSASCSPDKLGDPWDHRHEKR